MIDPFAWAAGWVQENLLLPIMFQFGWMEWEDTSFLWALFAIYGVLQVVINYAVCVPMERLRPLQRGIGGRLVATDVLYTLIARVGVFPLVTFFGFYTLQTWINGFLTDHGYVPPTLERFFPFLLGVPLLTFFVYAALLDCTDYWRHRLSHRFAIWYGLHSVHHAQTQMTFWSDDRNHVLDDVITYAWFVGVGLVIGVPPMQFPLLILALKLVESASHANTTLTYGWLGERLLVSPQFHRAHHGLQAAGRRSCNYGAVFPWWDMMFGTADFRRDVVETGDRGAHPSVVSGSWWDQQRGGFVRAAQLAAAVRGKRKAARQRITAAE